MSLARIVKAFLEERNLPLMVSGTDIYFRRYPENPGDWYDGWIELLGTRRLRVSIIIAHVPEAAGPFIEALPEYGDTLFLRTQDDSETLEVRWNSGRQYLGDEKHTVFATLADIMEHAESQIAFFENLFQAEAGTELALTPDAFATLATGSIGHA